VLIEGIGEKLSPMPTIDGWLVIVQPPQGLSTPAVYGAWDTLNRESGRATTKMLGALSSHDLRNVGVTVDDLRALAKSHATLARFDLRAIAAALGNDLTPAAEHLDLQVEPLKKILIGLGALGAEMTGSGSAVFGLFENETSANAAANHIQKRREKLGIEFVAAAAFSEQAVRFSGTHNSTLK
jgi:4-diphosphocytidyl-2-C-methyl-D-erythritol kinase